MTPKIRMILGAASLAAATLFTGCEEIAPIVTEDALSSVETRSSALWDWETTRISNAAAIAAYDQVFVMGEDGASLWIGSPASITGGTGNINPRAYFSAFKNDPVVKMAAGPESTAGIGSGGTGNVWHKGVYMVTKSGALYELYYSKGHFWVEKVSAPTAKDVAVNERGTVFVLRDTDRDDEIYQLGNRSFHVFKVSPQPLESIAARNNYDGFVVGVSKSGKLLEFYKSHYGYVDCREMNTSPWTAVHDVAAQPNPSRGIWGHAFFFDYLPSHGIGHVKIKPRGASQYQDVDWCRKIAIDNEGNLWDAWLTSVRVRKKALPRPWDK